MLEFEGRVTVFICAILLVCAVPFINGTIKNPAQNTRQEKTSVRLTAAEYIDQMGPWIKSNKIREATAQPR